MKTCRELTIAPMSAQALLVYAGQVLRITDIQGGQAGDLIAFLADDTAIRFSQARTRVENRRVAITGGDSLWTNDFPPREMLTIIRDPHGPHDLLYTPCCRYALEKRFGVCRDGCLENLARAMQPWGLKPHDLPDPLNLFFRVGVDGSGAMEIHRPTSTAGAWVELQARMDCLVAISTCAAPRPDGPNTPYQVAVFEN